MANAKVIVLPSPNQQPVLLRFGKKTINHTLTDTRVAARVASCGQCCSRLSLSPHFFLLSSKKGIHVFAGVGWGLLTLSFCGVVRMPGMRYDRAKYRGGEKKHDKKQMWDKVLEMLS